MGVEARNSSAQDHAIVAATYNWSIWVYLCCGFLIQEEDRRGRPLPALDWRRHPALLYKSRKPHWAVSSRCARWNLPNVNVNSTPCLACRTMFIVTNITFVPTANTLDSSVPSEWPSTTVYKNVASSIASIAPNDLSFVSFNWIYSCYMCIRIQMRNLAG